MLLALGAVVLAAGALAGLITGGTLAQARGGLVQSVAHAVTGNLDAAFEPAPSPWAFWPLVVALAGGTAALIVWLARRFGGRSEGAQWGGRKVETTLRAPHPPAQRQGRITAGRGQVTKRIVAAKPSISATVFGIPGSAKTAGLVLPNAAEWRGPLVVTTTKAADLDVIYARRAALGPVWVIAPTGIPGRTTHRWSPVDYANSPKAADRMAAWMAEASSSGGDKRAAPWVDQARNVLKGILLAAHLSGGGVTKMRQWLALGKDAVDYVVAVLEEYGYNDVAEDYSGPWLRLHADGIGSIQFTLNVIARVYSDEEVRDTSAGTDFTVDELLDRNGTVCLIANEADAERFAPLLTSIIASIIHGAESRYDHTGKALDPMLGIMVDEAGNMLRYPRLPNILTTGRGMGIVLLTVWHDLSQLRDRLGQQAANTVLSASGLRMLLPGCGDLETLRYFNGLFGRQLVERASRTSGGGGNNSTQWSHQETDLAPIHELQQLPDFTAIAQYSNLPPIKINMRLTFRDRDVKQWLAVPHQAPATGTEVPR
ncbi:type IV secretory system conjugative DNA transfer family protein [Streptomyces sp. G-5]|nr:type IV secretory system conjugative DNA transfer family protein [Streptomyces sp. G-5]MCU4750305.1 type IV secretory system conjugative DNA transfer family protein [Streptomyces sp. G-5]